MTLDYGNGGTAVNLENFDLAALEEFEEAFQEAPESKDSDRVPDGKYLVAVEKVELTQAKTTGKNMLKWQLRILSPKNCANRVLFRNNMMASAENVKWLKQDLCTCGLKLEKLTDLPNRLHELLDVQLEVTARTRGEHQNVYLNKRVTLEGNFSKMSAGKSSGSLRDGGWGGSEEPLPF